MLIIPVIKGLEHILKVRVLLNHNSLQLTIASNSHTKVVADRAKIYYLKFTAELLFKGVNNSFTVNNFNIIYIN
jgi:hypothetical protein